MPGWRRLALACWLVLLAAPAGCSRGKNKSAAAVPTTPEEIAKAFVAAVNAQDEAAVLALFPGDDVISGSLTCKKGIETQLLGFKRSRERAVEQLKKGAGLVLTFLSIEATDPPQKIAKGEVRGDCQATIDVTNGTWMVSYSVSRDGKVLSEKDRNEIRFIEIGRRWYLRDL